MDYVTNYYKNLSEQLQRQINILESQLNEFALLSEYAPPDAPPEPQGPPSPPANKPGGSQYVPPPGSQPGVIPPPPDPGMWDPDGDGTPNQPPSNKPPEREKGESLEDYLRRKERWQKEFDSYREYLKKLRTYQLWLERNRRPRRL